VGSWDFVIQELGIGNTGTGIMICGFVVKEVYIRYRYLSRIYDKKIKLKSDYDNQIE